MSTIRLTAAQAMVRLLAAARTTIDGESLPLSGGVWAIFGHGNVAAMGEALAGARDELPTYRAHNEQAMAMRPSPSPSSPAAGASWPEPPRSGPARPTWSPRGAGAL